MQSVNWALIIRLGVPSSVPADSNDALCFTVCFASVKTKQQPPCS